jgi:hypothetical protein
MPLALPRPVAVVVDAMGLEPKIGREGAGWDLGRWTDPPSGLWLVVLPVTMPQCQLRRTSLDTTSPTPLIGEGSFEHLATRLLSGRRYRRLYVSPDLASEHLISPILV